MSLPNYYRIEDEEDIKKVVVFMKENNIKYESSYEALSFFEAAEVDFHLSETFILKDDEGNVVQPNEELKNDLANTLGDAEYLDSEYILSLLKEELMGKGFQVEYKNN